MERAPLQPFQLEVERLSGPTAAGAVDGRRITLRLEESTQKLVAYHEYIHARLLATTPDGPPSPLLDRLTGARALLFETARFPQEVLATYLGVKYLAPEQHASALDRLPSTYLDYYETLAGVLDDTFHTSYLQSLIAWNIGVVTFSSGALPSFVVGGSAEAWTLAEGDSAEHRLRQLLAALTPGACRELLRRLEGSHVPVGAGTEASAWDLQSEADWERHAGIGTRVEAALSEVIRPWLQEVSGLSLLADAAFVQGMRDLQALVGSAALDLDVPPALAFDPGRLDRDVVVQAWWDAGSLLTNAGATRFPPADGALLARPELLSTLGAFQIVSEAPPTHLERATLLGWGPDAKPGGPPTAGGSFGLDALLKWLRWRRDAELHGLPVPEALALTLAVRDFADWSEVAEPVFSAITTPVGDTGALAGSAAGALCWYWTENWLELLL